MTYFIVTVLFFLELSNLNINFLLFVKGKKGKHTKFVGYWRELKDKLGSLPPPPNQLMQSQSILHMTEGAALRSRFISVVVLRLLLNLFQHVPELIVPSGSGNRNIIVALRSQSISPCSMRCSNNRSWYRFDFWGLGPKFQTWLSYPLDGLGLNQCCKAKS